MSHFGEQADNHNSTGALIPSNRWGTDVSIDAKLVKRNLSDIKDKIAPCKPRIIGVTKYYGLSSVVSGYEAGLRDFGESRAVEAVKKIEALPNEIRKNSTFHFIGHLQTNKAEKVVKYFDIIHSVDSLKVAAAISDVSCRLNKREKILLQVNNAGEEQKFGYGMEGLVNDFPEILKLKGVEVIGLMNMAAFGASREVLEKTFRELREFRDGLEHKFGAKLPELSMGMSDDYEVAVKEGATMIRIGRKLFT